MRRLIQIIVAFCFLACLIGTAFADVLYVPDDDFLRSHPSDYEGRSYIVNAASGYTGIYQDPEQQEPIAYAENDSAFFVSYIYLNGSASWGLVDWTDLPDGKEDPRSTIPLHPGPFCRKEAALCRAGLKSAGLYPGPQPIHEEDGKPVNRIRGKRKKEKGKLLLFFA